MNLPAGLDGVVSPRKTVLTLMALGLLFGGLAIGVWFKATLTFDEAVLGWVHEFTSPGLDKLMVGITNLGGVTGMIVLTGLAMTALWFRGQFRLVWFVFLSVGGAAFVNQLVKALFGRPRPELWAQIVDEPGFSFPSGHAMASMAFVLSLIVVLWPTKWRWVSVVVGGVFVCSIGLSRLYLGVHYPTDVLAGWLASMAWVLAMLYFLRIKGRAVTK